MTKASHAALSGVFALVVLIFTDIQSSSSATALYNEGNALYRKGAFVEAVALYEDALSTGLENSDVYYNLGNAHYKVGELGLAILNYERALRLNPMDADILGNISFANGRITDRFEEDPPNIVTRFLVGLYDLVPPNGLSVVVSVALVMGCLGGGAILFSGRHRLTWGAVIAFSVLSCGLGATVLAIKVADLSTPQGIVLAVEIVGRSGPGSDFLQVFMLHEGTKIVLERQEGAWGLIRLPNGLGGWVPLDAIRMI